MKFKKNLAPNTWILINSLSMVLILTVLYIFSCFLFYDHILILPLLIMDAGIFILSYIIYRYILEKFIYNKIKLIYKTIHTLKVPKGKKNVDIDMNQDIISQMNLQVETWAQERRTEIEELKKQEAYRREFLGDVSHELKTPLFNIQGYILTLLEGGLDDPEINKEYLIRSSKNIERMIAVIEDLEIISRLETGRFELDQVNFDIVALTHDVIDLLEAVAKKKNIRIYIPAEFDSSDFVYADKERIRQVLINLIDNSIKYGSDDGNTKISFFDMDENLLIEVTDDGIGIEAKNLPRLFERFFRVDKSRSREQGGSGLGLAIVKHIIEAHDQAINVRSTAGVGTTFAFTLRKSRTATH